MATRLRRRSPPPTPKSPTGPSLQRTWSLSPSPSPSPTRRRAISPAKGQSRDPPSVFLPSGGYRKSRKCGHCVVALLVCAWVAGFGYIMMYELDEDEDISRFPAVMNSIRGRATSTRLRAIANRKNRHHREHKLPKHYFQLSPPTQTEANHSSPWSWPIIHIVSTRFMQGQGSLLNLARSRLKLLEVICLPSLFEQTILSHDGLAGMYEGTKWEEEVEDMIARLHEQRLVVDPLFIWIIKVDPDIDRTVLSELNAILEPVKSFTLVVGSNSNFGVGVKPGGWRGGQAGEDILNALKSGRGYFPEDNDHAYDMILRAHEAREARIVLETRLDADDAINVGYIESLQRTAVNELIDSQVSSVNNYEDADNNKTLVENEQTETARWLYWCAETHVQWNPSFDTEDHPGLLQVFQMPQTCVTTGLTLGFALGTDDASVPRYEHSKVYWEITEHHNNEGNKPNATAEIDVHDCGLYPSSRCAVFVNDPKVSAFRSRALTSAGMHNIEAQGGPSTDTPKKYKKLAAKLWKGTIETSFAIKPKEAKKAVEYLSRNYLGTVRDNLRGQCTSGHSCKISSLEKLQSTIDILQEEIGGLAPV